MRLLLVVEGGLIRSAYCAVLSSRHLDFDVASSPADGLARLRRQAYDVILSEDNVAGMRGIDFVNALRTFDRSVPVVLMTDGPTAEATMPGGEYGVCRYVSKSVGIDVLEETLRRADPRPALSAMHTENGRQDQAGSAASDGWSISPALR